MHVSYPGKNLRSSRQPGGSIAGHRRITLRAARVSKRVPCRPLRATRSLKFAALHGRADAAVIASIMTHNGIRNPSPKRGRCVNSPPPKGGGFMGSAARSIHHASLPPFSEPRHWEAGALACR